MFGRPLAPCIYDMNQFQRKIQKKLEAQTGLQLSSPYQLLVSLWYTCRVATKSHLQGVISLHRKQNKNARSWRKGMKKLKLKKLQKLKGRKKSFPKLTEPVGLRSRRCADWSGHRGFRFCFLGAAEGSSHRMPVQRFESFCH